MPKYTFKFPWTWMTWGDSFCRYFVKRQFFGSKHGYVTKNNRNLSRINIGLYLCSICHWTNKHDITIYYVINQWSTESCKHWDLFFGSDEHPILPSSAVRCGTCRPTTLSLSDHLGRRQKVCVCWWDFPWGIAKLVKCIMNVDPREKLAHRLREVRLSMIWGQRTCES